MIVVVANNNKMTTTKMIQLQPYQQPHDWYSYNDDNDDDSEQ